MKEIKKLNWVIIALLFSISINGQNETNNSLENSLCQEWNFKYYEMSDEILPIPPEQKGDKLIFHKDNTVSAIASGDKTSGVWQYDESSGILFITPNETKIKTPFKIIKITSLELVIETKGPDGIDLKIHWKKQNE